MKKKLLLIPGALCFTACLFSQTIYVDAIKGSRQGKGTVTDPLAGVEQAVALASTFSGEEPVTIKVAPGLYTVSQEMEIKTEKKQDDTIRYTIEATIMPDDEGWSPVEMPIIQSISANNSSHQFIHCVGFLVAKNNVHFKGLKLLGNANPSVRYYYPITRENPDANGLEVSQCYFVGEKNSSAIQGAIWAHGSGTTVDHCIFFECKNALLLFNSIKNLSVTNCIINGSYEAAVWFGPFLEPFVFRNNIVTHCNYFWLRAANTQAAYTFSNSIITGNDHYLGYYGKELEPATGDSVTETHILKTAKLLFSEVKTEGLPNDYLNLLPESDGVELQAGVFKKSTNAIKKPAKNKM
ncbi:MAG: right-handed parallel beta-helix repeat-containing protein [Bacteroidetes bacterium]|nr:right-handed parallel beta-helix repeat-containing protein [Bacteroidota bacterium]